MLWTRRAWLRLFTRNRDRKPRASKPPKRKVTLEVEPLERRFLLTTVGFSTTTPSVAETAGNATITVTLNASSSQTITVDYASSDGSATAGIDYNAVSGTLTFNAGDTSKTFLVPITDSDTTTSSHTVSLTLSNPTHATLNFPNNHATLTITQTTPTSWTTSGAQAVSDPDQGQAHAFGLAALSPLTGAVQLAQPLDLGLSAGAADFPLVYDSSSVDVRPLFNATFASNGGGPVPSSLSVQLTWNGTTQSAVSFATTGHSAGDTYAVAAQVASAVTSNGAYNWSLHLIASFSSRGNVDRTVSGVAWAVVNDGTDPFGKGWSLAGLDSLIDQSSSNLGVLWVSGSGGARYFAPVGGLLESPVIDQGTLVKNQDGSYTYTAKDQAHQYFDSSGHEVRFVDRHNLTTTFSYSSGRLSTIANPDGSVGTFTYDGSNLLQTVTAPGNRTTTLTHNGSADTTAITDAAGNERDFTYSGAHRVLSDVYGPLRATFTYDSTTGAGSTVDRGLGNTLSLAPQATQGLATSPALNSSQAVGVLTDALNQKASYTLDSLGRMTQLQTPDGATQTSAFNSAGSPTAYTDGLSRTTTLTYTSSQDLTRIDYPDGSNEQFQYDSTFHQMTQHQDTLNQRTTYTIDSNTGDRLTVKDALNNVTTYTWSSGLLQTVTDPLNHKTTFQYDGNRRLQDSIDALNERTTYSYDNAGNVQTVKDALNRVTTATYDGSRRVLSVIDATGGVTSYAYNAIDEVTSTTDALGRVTNTTYNQLGLVSSITQAVGTSVARTLTYTYDALGRQITESDALNHTATFGYDPVGRLRTETRPVGGVVTATYDLAGERTAMTDALNHTTSFSYNARGWVTEVRGALNNVTTMVYDTEGNTLATVDARGDRTTFGYDGLNREITQKDSLNNVTTFVYDAAGNLVGIVDARNNRTTLAYDALNRFLSQTDALNHTSTVAYDAVGNVVRGIDAANSTTTLAYDNLSRLVSRQDPSGGTATFVYDAVGNLVNRIDPLNHKATYVYDALNRPTQSIDAQGGTTTVVYDAANNQTAIVDPVGNRTTFSYDAANRLTQVTDPFTKNTTYAYDLANRLTSTTDRLGRRRDIVYDAANRRTTETWVTSGSTVNTLTYTYDAASNLLTAADHNGTYTFTYDALNRLATQKDIWVLTLTYTYDAVSNRTLVQDSLGGTLTSTYDAVNELTYREFAGGGLGPIHVTVGYTARGQLATVMRYTGVGPSVLVGESDYSYDAAGRLSNLQHKNGSGSNLANYTFTYDAASRVLTEVLNGTTTSYSYDATNQLTNDGTATYSYDADGNRTMTGYSTGTGNRLTSDGTWTYSYDDDGNLIKKSKGANAETWTYGYDQRNHMVWAEDRATDGGTLLMRADYKYDVFGDRIEKAVDPDGAGPLGTTTTRFAYDGSNIWADLDGTNALLTRRLYLDTVDAVFARIAADGTVAWYLPDRLGSIRDLTDNSGVVQDHLDYDGYGNATESNSVYGDRYKFTGREFDAETGLGYYRRRIYDPKQGRFESQDPIGFGAGDTNLYRYVFNGPTIATDPTGLRPIIATDPTGLRPPVTPMIYGQYLHQFKPSIWKEVVRKWQELHPKDLSILNQNRQIEDDEIDELKKAYEEAIRRAKEEARKWMPDLESQYIHGPLMAVVLGGSFGSRGRFFVAKRVAELQGQIPTSQRGRITMSVGVVQDANGNRSVLISTSEPQGYLRPGVTLKPGETMAAGTGHAEADIIAHAKANNLTVIEIGATRPVCGGCQDVIRPTGANIVTPLK